MIRIRNPARNINTMTHARSAMHPPKGAGSEDDLWHNQNGLDESCHVLVVDLKLLEFCYENKTIKRANSNVFEKIYISDNYNRNNM